jgi:uncharacterized membrane protein required for colicin V production
MVSLQFMFFCVIALMAVIGAFRGWAKELLVLFSIVFALFVIYLMNQNFQFYRDFIAQKPENEFWVNAIIILAMSFFGYQTPQRIGFLAERSIRVRVQDFVLGLLFGGINGYFLFGSIWFYLDKAEYFVNQIDAPAAEQVAKILGILPPSYMMSTPVITTAIAVAFLLIIVVYL